jgi:hypothetical protein
MSDFRSLYAVTRSPVLLFGWHRVAEPTPSTKSSASAQSLAQPLPGSSGLRVNARERSVRFWIGRRRVHPLTRYGHCGVPHLDRLQGCGACSEQRNTEQWPVPPNHSQASFRYRPGRPVTLLNSRGEIFTRPHRQTEPKALRQIKRGQLDKTFTDAAFGLILIEYSDPIDTPSGFEIIRRTE